MMSGIKDGKGDLEPCRRLIQVQVAISKPSVPLPDVFFLSDSVFCLVGNPVQQLKN